MQLDLNLPLLNPHQSTSYTHPGKIVVGWNTLKYERNVKCGCLLHINILFWYLFRPNQNLLNEFTTPTLSCAWMTWPMDKMVPRIRRTLRRKPWTFFKQEKYYMCLLYRAHNGTVTFYMGRIMWRTCFIEYILSLHWYFPFVTISCNKDSGSDIFCVYSFVGYTHEYYVIYRIKHMLDTRRNAKCLSIPVTTKK